MAVQDYKINYKSDFVLNINGDAGWAIPFCIKFWTGMPSQAYFVGFDGVKYVNCRVGDTPTQLLVMFDDHHMPIGPLKMQIAYHTTIEEFPGSVFDEVTNARDVIVTIDGTDYQVLLDFTGEDAPELEFDLPAYANEAERIQNELQRQQNEADRIAAELQREQATAAAVQGAENVNAQLNGTTLTVTNRLGVSTSVNTKGEQGEQGPVGPQGETGETGPRGTSIVSFTPKSATATTLIYTVTFSDGHTQAVAIPKGPKGDTGATGPQGQKGDTGVSITAFTYASETETDMIYTVTFSDGTTQQVSIPKGAKGDQGPVGPQGPQGPMGDVAVITPEQQAAFTMYSTTGQNTNGPMTQKAVTDEISNIGNYIGGVIGYNIIPSSSVGWTQGVINSATGAVVSSDKRCYTAIPINGRSRKINMRIINDLYFIHTVVEYSSSTIGTGSFIRCPLVPVTGVYPQSFYLTTSNYVVVVVALKANTTITPTNAGNYTIIEQASEDLNCKGLNDLQGAGKVVNLTMPQWIVGAIDSNGANTPSDYRLRFGWILETGIIELYAGDTLYIESVFIYNLSGTKTATVVYGQSLERLRYTVESGYKSRVCIKRRDGAAMTADMGGLLVASNVQTNSRIFDVEEKADDVDVRLTDVEDKLTGGEETVIPLHRGGRWAINSNPPGFLEVEGYSYSDPYPVSPGDRIKVTLSTGSGGSSVAVYGCPTSTISAGGTVVIGYGFEVHNAIYEIPVGVNYIFISSRDEDFDPPFNPSASLITGGWLEEQIDKEIEKSAFSNPFHGLKLVALGDSITQGQVYDGPVPVPFANVAAEELGMDCINYGIGGSTIAACENYGGTFASLADFNAATKDTSKYYVVMTGRQTYTDYRYNGSSWVTTTIAMRTPLVDRYDLMDDDADIILVSSGSNDFYYNWTEIGEITDTVKTTFRGAMNVLCTGLINKYPKKCIIFLTPLKRGQTQQASESISDTTAHRGGSDGTIDHENLFGKTMKDYCDIIKEMCDRYSIPVIDVYSESMLVPQLASQYDMFDSYHTHPLQAGHNIIARLIVGKLRSIFGMNV